MEAADFIKSGLGAIIGFSLAQLVNLASLTWNWWRSPKLEIEIPENALLISHTTQISANETGDEKYYGFIVKNTGPRIATGVRFQIIGIQLADKRGAYYDFIEHAALDLSVYTGAESTEAGPKEITLVPGAGATVALAWWREDNDAVRPCVDHAFDYYDEVATISTDYGFKVVAFDDSGQLASTHVYISR